jgi:invasion protein IalB
MYSAISKPIIIAIARFAKPAIFIATFALLPIEFVKAQTQFRSTTFDDWTVKCTPILDTGIDLNAGLDHSTGLECSLSQRIEFEDSNERLLLVELYLNPTNSIPEAVFVLPLGIPLDSPPLLSFNNSRSVNLSVSHCHSDGCYFKLPLSSRLLEQFLSMHSGQIKLSGNGSERLQIPISGRGSRSAHNYFTALPKD